MKKGQDTQLIILMLASNFSSCMSRVLENIVTSRFTSYHDVIPMCFPEVLAHTSLLHLRKKFNSFGFQLSSGVGASLWREVSQL